MDKRRAADAPFVMGPVGRTGRPSRANRPKIAWIGRALGSRLQKIDVIGSAGVEFIPENGRGATIRLKRA
jgi:hypothetical protein